MADERTEQATPRRREEARHRGEAPRSAELAGAAALVGALLGLRLGWPALLRAAVETARSGLRECARPELTVESTGALATAALLQAARMVAPLAVGACLAAAAVNLGQGGFLVSAQPLIPKWQRVSVTQGLRRMWSARGLFSVARSLLKAAAVLAVTFLFVRGHWREVLGLAHGTAASAGAALGGLIWGLLIQVSAVMLAVAIADCAFQWREFEKSLRMTRQELREEHKRTEGDPLVRARLRERQRALARHRMLEAVKKATVVVVNPVEIAVALRYEVAKMPAPVVVAKGRRLMAERIRDQAERHGVPVLRNQELARALYRSVPVGKQIPLDLYQAVAEILVFVYRRSGWPAERER
jgi:flagellar biosynthetic protein FlhB